MHFLSLLTLTALAAFTSAAPPAPAGNGLMTRQECPYAQWLDCTNPRYSSCISSGIDVCLGQGCGGPCLECDKFCRASAASECVELGCVDPNGK
ncbi:hypothetical protein LIA77_00755 [Sarocladium implicatum]|nr:hypothetical protein LIA77_00755 [Sarocladium implicatum]